MSERESTWSTDFWRAAAVAFGIWAGAGLDGSVSWSIAVMLGVFMFGVLQLTDHIFTAALNLFRREPHD